VFNVTEVIDGWKLQRVVVRANSFFCASTTNVSTTDATLRAHQVPWSADGLSDAEGKLAPFGLTTILVLNGQSKLGKPFPTENLLEDTDGLRRPS
jgi:hypothetical protein